MKTRAKIDVAAVLGDRSRMDAALAAGVREALRSHVQMGVPAVEWHDGKTVFVQPEQIAERLRKIEKKEPQQPSTAGRSRKKSQT